VVTAKTRPHPTNGIAQSEHRFRLSFNGPLLTLELNKSEMLTTRLTEAEVREEVATEVSQGDREALKTKALNTIPAWKCGWITKEHTL